MKEDTMKARVFLFAIIVTMCVLLQTPAFAHEDEYEVRSQIGTYTYLENRHTGRKITVYDPESYINEQNAQFNREMQESRDRNKLEEMESEIRKLKRARDTKTDDD